MDSIFFPGASSGGGGSSDIAIASLAITDVQLRSLFTVPLTIVAAPGVGKVIVPIRATLKGIRSGTAFSVDVATRIRWAGIATDTMGTATFTWNSAVAATLYRLLIDALFNGSTSDDPSNKALQVSNSADMTLGTGCSLVVSVQYYIATI